VTDSRLSSEGIAYYRVRLGHGYWSPTKRMKFAGFQHVTLGPDGPEARAEARKWNTRWQEVRKDLPKVNGEQVQHVRASELHYVYFLRVEDRIKIGFSRRPMSRAAHVATGAPGRMASLVIVRGSRADERQLHLRFAVHRTRGEWFAAARPVLAAMTRSILAGRVVHDERREQSRPQESDFSGVGPVPGVGREKAETLDA
jgi:hypothetical protein